MRWVLQNFAHIQLSQVERKLEKRDSSVYTQDLHIEYSIKSTFTFKQRKRDVSAYKFIVGKIYTVR